VAPVVPKKAKPSAKQTVAAAAAATSSTEPKAENEESLPPDTKYAANGRRDPFISPVVSHSSSSSCTSGKKCLEIGAINLKGVVHGESGFIAVVSNGLNKAYFLRENDPVFNGYVVKITGDSIVFQETLQDRLGKSFTREVVKKITTPAV
jgi:Tfp pilus assembly protein PilP